jgi:hypothetical protein
MGPIGGVGFCRGVACTVAAAALLGGLTMVARAAGSAEDRSGQSYQGRQHDRRYQPRVD